MPNQGNKSNGKSGSAKPKKNSTMPSTQKQGSENSVKKGEKGDLGSSAKSKS